MIVAGDAVPVSLVVETEAAVIGSGAGGAAVAKELAESGVEVALFEAGGHHTTKDFTQREEEMLPKIYEESGARATADGSVLIMQGRTLGGSTVHNICLAFRPERAIVERWQDENAIQFGYDDLVPYLERVERHVGVNPIQPHQVNVNNAIFKRGCEQLKINSRLPNHNRIECLGCGYCDLACAYNRKQSTLITYIPKAIAAGATIYCNCRADTIRVFDNGKRFEIVGNVLTPGTEHIRGTFKVAARVVVLAGGAVNTPAILQKSNLAADNGAVGQSLRLHPYVPVAGVFDEKVEGWRGIPQSQYTDDFAEFKTNGYGGYYLITGFAHPGSTAGYAPGIGAEHQDVMSQFAHLAAAGVMVHDETKGTVSVAASGRPSINYWPTMEDQHTLVEGVVKLVDIYMAAGATRVLLPFTTPVWVTTAREARAAFESRGVHPHDVALTSVHPQGTCPMGEDPAAAVVNSFGESHETPGLFIADTSVYPTSLGTPPNIPTMTWGTWVAAHLVRNRDKYFRGA